MTAQEQVLALVRAAVEAVLTAAGASLCGERDRFVLVPSIWGGTITKEDGRPIGAFYCEYKRAYLWVRTPAGVRHTWITLPFAFGGFTQALVVGLRKATRPLKGEAVA
jgi:hypothetical protein